MGNMASWLREKTIEEEILYLPEYRRILAQHPVGHRNRASSLSDVAFALGARFDSFGDKRDLDESIALYREAFSLHPVGHRSVTLRDLAFAIETRFARFGGDVKDIDEAIILHWESLLLHPATHNEHSRSLHYLASSIFVRFDSFGDVKDLEEAIFFHREALSLRPAGHSDRPASLNNLAAAIDTRFDRFGEVKDIGEAIALHREALSLCPPGDKNRSSSLINLANAICNQFGRFGDVKDLDDAIVLYREALSLHNTSHSDRFMLLGSLATAVLTRFAHFGDAKDIDEAIALHRAALSVCPADHRYRSISINNLAAAISARFNSFRGELKDIDEAIVLLREALSLCPAGFANRSLSLNNLADAIGSRYHRSGDVKDIDEAIALHREALTLCPADHNIRHTLLKNLGTVIGDRYWLTADPRDLDEAITLAREALSLLPQGHFMRPQSSGTLGYYLVVAAATRRVGGVPPQPLLDEAEPLLNIAVTDPHSSVRWQLDFALRTARKALHGSSFRLSMCLQCIHLLQKYVVVSPNILDQQTYIAPYKNSASTICAFAVEAGSPETAVSILDGGRSLLLGIMQRYRSPVDQIRDASHELADELQSTGVKLERLSILGARATGPTPKHTSQSEFLLITQRRLRKQWDRLIGQVRCLPGFEQFLSNPPYYELQMAASEGPIILLNACTSRCDGFIVFSSGPPEVLSFNDRVSLESLMEMYKKLDQARSARLPGDQRKGLCSVLEFLWNNIVSSIVDCLQSRGVKRGSRVWWCPASIFSLLPLHAAGLYGEDPNYNFTDIYVSSYTPTISELLRARRARQTATMALEALPSRHPVIFVGHSGKHGELDVEKELEIISRKDGIEVVSLLNSRATPDNVLEALNHHPWAHFACHGVLNKKSPSESYFELEGRRLTVKDIISAKLDSRAELAFLSACESAAPGDELPDEAIHLTSALMFAGFRSVIGTMWEMHDSEGPLFAELFYRHLIKLGGRHTDAAMAIHRTIKSRRKADFKRGYDRFRPERWAMFIHIGA